jgi:hypothetical protein
MDRKGVEAFLADATPFTIGSHESLIDPKTRLLANGALHRTESAFNFLLSQDDHSRGIPGERYDRVEV